MRPHSPPPLVPPRVCDCGYNLSGIAPGDDARCPECWRLLRNLRGPETLLDKGWVLAGLMFAPGVAMLLGFPIMGSVPAGPPVVLVVGLILFLVVSVPACITVAVDRTGRMDPILHGLLSIGVVPACALGNALLGFIGLLLVR